MKDLPAILNQSATLTGFAAAGKAGTDRLHDGAVPGNAAFQVAQAHGQLGSRLAGGHGLSPPGQSGGHHHLLLLPGSRRPHRGTPRPAAGGSLLVRLVASTGAGARLGHAVAAARPRREKSP